MLIICILWTMYRIEQEVYPSSENYGKYNQIIFERSLTYFITLFQIRETVFGIICIGILYMYYGLSIQGKQKLFLHVIFLQYYSCAEVRGKFISFLKIAIGLVIISDEISWNFVILYVLYMW